MRTNGTKRRVKAEQVLADLAALSNAQLELLMPQVFALRAQRGRDILSARETKLLQKIDRGLPLHVQAELDRLVEKRRAGTLTREEVRRLHNLTEKAELFDARRLRYLVELSGLRKITLEKLMRSLGLKTPAYA